MHARTDVAVVYRLARRGAERLPPALYRPLLTLVRTRRSAGTTRQVLSVAPVTEWEVPVCAVCGGSKVARHTSVNGYSIVRCKTDGLIYVSPRPGDLTPFYAEFYYTGGLPAVYGDYALHARESMHPIWNERLQTLQRLAGRIGTLLDVGAADGSFLALAADVGWRVQGIEISDWAANEARKQFGLSVLVGALPDPRIPDRSF